MAMKTDTQYQKEDDARTLIRAEEIRNDKKRLSGALAELKKQKNATLNALKVSGSNTTGD